jgi:hypothetical protein
MTLVGTMTAEIKRHPLAVAICAVVAFKVCLILIGVALQGLNQVVFSASGDAFRSIARDGYPEGSTAAELTRYAYYPLFVVALKVLLLLPVSLAVSTILLGVGVTVAILLLLYRLLEPLLGSKVALLALLAWGFAPPGWIYLAAFSEGMFALLQLSLLHAMNKNRFWVTAALSGLLGVSRVQGAFWALAACVWILKSAQSWVSKLFGIAIALSGAIMWQVVIMLVTGNLFGYRDIVAAHQASNGFGIQPLLTAAEGVMSLISGNLDLAISAALALAGVLVLFILLLRERSGVPGRIPTIVTALSGVFISADPGTQMTRYVTSSPILFTGLAAVISRHHALAILSIVLLAVTSIVHTLFSHGYWQMIP